MLLFFILIKKQIIFKKVVDFKRKETIILSVERKQR